MKSIAFVLLLLSVGGVSQGATDREVFLQSQLATTTAQLDAARAELGKRGPPATKIDVQQAKDAVAENTAEISTLRMQLPINSVPVWLAAISGLVSVCGILGSIVLTILNRGKLNEIHVLANSNLARISAELTAAHALIAEIGPRPSNKTA